ncbi:protein wntless-like isoform X2 [Centruroides sculpturatus]|uniref:protein wntless-like isoform X1 n=2 Tax=Centruroides sculpturatus TaxID=218467 RepID=UPI000C6E5903|nr:protein wntless-like isoform X1 [Centruroides sculpturatus]XP_023226792.1 protein wntless-like isoform X2 [Centruroides sculpturatus]
MAGTILENLSGKKLAVLVSFILICQVICFLIGGCIAPSPSNADMVLSTKCVLDKPINPGEYDDVWHIPRGKNGVPINCNKIEELDDPKIIRNHVSPNQIVFAVQVPLAKESVQLDYSRWMQNLIAVLHPDIVHKKYNPLSRAKHATMTMVVKLGYRNKWDPEDKWTLIANSTEQRKLDCKLDKDKEQEDYLHNCEVLPLFELGSLHHDYYLINLQLPVSVDDSDILNHGIGVLKDIWIVLITQNGGFTKVWLSLKTFFFPIIIATMIWYWHRINLLTRPPVLLEKMLLGLGIALSFLNLPLEFLTLFIEMPFMLLLADIRQGIFYAALLSFWLVFCGEHQMEGRKDDVERNRLRSYWRHLSAVAFGCLCLFLFDMCERGVQLKNPFYSIWVTELGTNLALGFIILAGISACLYFVFLCYMVYKVFRNIGFKRSTLPSMSSTRRMYYEGIIYRFKFLMMSTLLCAALTVISYIIGQVSEGRWKWDQDIRLEFTSAFFTGVYGMWNLYVFALLVLYAPSHKFYPPGPTNALSSTQEEIEFSRLTSEPSPSEPTEISALTEFAKKSALD